MGNGRFTFCVCCFTMGLRNQGFTSEGDCMTPEQCRAARGLLNWTQLQLSERAMVCRKSVVNFETGGAMKPSSIDAMRRALEAGGAELMDEPSQGVCFTRKAA